jgi:hypothetical protein
VRRSEFVPILLVAGVGAFIVVQATKVRRGAHQSQPAVKTASPATIAPQGQLTSAAVQPSGGVSVDGVTELRRSDQPPPERDDSAVSAQIRDNAAGTYVLDVLHEQSQLLMRWPEHRFNALRVWIDRQPDATGWEPAYALVAEHVFDEWREAGFPLAFDIVPDSTNTNIRITWVTRFPESEGRRIGVTHKTRDQHGWLRTADIVVALHDLRGDVLPPSTIAGVVRHEVGHALGLGHSTNPADVMYPEARTDVISAADRATLHLIYTLPPGPVKP